MTLNTNFTVSYALTLTTNLTLIAIALQTIELLCLRQIYTPTGAWAWHIIRDDFKHTPQFLRRFLDALFAHKIFVSLLCLQLVIALWLICTQTSPTFAMVFYLFCLTLLVSIRFRGSVNGGNDTMMLVLLSSLTTIAWFSNNPLIANVGLFYIGLQSGLSYLVAGFVKIRNPEWRNGQALKQYLLESAYDVPQIIRTWAQHSRLVCAAAWVSMLFELGFVALFWFPATVPYWLVAGLVFHLCNFVVFGLNRFAWTWLATYPSVIWLAMR